MTMPIATLALSWSTGLTAIVLLVGGWLLGSYLAGLMDAALSRTGLDPLARGQVQRLALPLTASARLPTTTRSSVCTATS